MSLGGPQGEPAHQRQKNVDVSTRRPMSIWELKMEKTEKYIGGWKATPGGLVAALVMHTGLTNLQHAHLVSLQFLSD